MQPERSAFVRGTSDPRDPRFRFAFTRRKGAWPAVEPRPRTEPWLLGTLERPAIASRSAGAHLGPYGLTGYVRSVRPAAVEPR
jgi:hypothetical protein